MLANRRLRSVSLLGFAATLSMAFVLAAASAADKPAKKNAEAKAAAKAVRQAAKRQAAIRNQSKAAAKISAAKPENDSATKTPAKSKAIVKAIPVAAKTARTATSIRATPPESPLLAVAAAQPASAAAEADRLLAAEIAALASSAAPQVADEIYLRRVSLDIAGRVPTAGELTAFALDPATDKRARAVERLLAEDAYGANWGRYWRDVIMYRKSDDRAMIVAASLEEYLTKEINKNTPWDELARSFITATGDVRENGNTAVIMAQMGETSDITAEMSRIFTGIQIQCAQCHNHPTDRWQRTQFHELAAFFPRIGVRPKNGDGQRSFEVASVDRGPAVRRPNNGKPRPSLEHYMPDLQNPSAEGTRMEPVFFVTSQKIPLGTPDKERRETIATWMTAPTNPWFAKAFVNRMWSELVGEGFYEPVDDIGPDREVTAPKTLDYLAAQFVANKHDIKWLFRTITATAAYQRASRSRRGADDTPMLAAAAQRLRADQLYTAITSIIGAPIGMQAPAGRNGNARGPRFAFNVVFGFDPSIRRDDITGSIPQALTIMNSPQLAAGMNGGRSGTFLSKLLTDEKDDTAVAVELYLNTLSREPSAKEIEICLAHLKQSGSRGEGFEDILWALLNSAEFTHRK